MIEKIASTTITMKIDSTTALVVLRPTASAEQIAHVARELLRLTDAESRNVRLLGVTGSGLSTGEDEGPRQLGLF